MKTKFILLIFTIGLISCDNTVDLISVGPPIPVVYGMFETEDQRQFIRVEKSFVDQNQSPSILAKDPNNLYFDDIEVLLTNSSGTKSLERVNGEDFGIVRDTGFFADSPNLLYTWVKGEDFVEGEEYQLQIVSSADTIMAESEMQILSDPFLRNFNSEVRAEIPVVDGEETSVRFAEAELISAYDFFLTVYISEDDGNGNVEPKVLNWQAINKTEDLNSGFKGEAMFGFLAENLEEDFNIERQLDSIYITAYGYDQNLKNYVEATASNTGITASNEVPVFTNVEGGYGLFSNRSVHDDGPFYLNKQSKQSLLNSEITKNLNFK